MCNGVDRANTAIRPRHAFRTPGTPMTQPLRSIDGPFGSLSIHLLSAARSLPCDP